MKHIRLIRYQLHLNIFASIFGLINKIYNQELELNIHNDNKTKLYAVHVIFINLKLNKLISQKQKTKQFNFNHDSQLNHNK